MTLGDRGVVYGTAKGRKALLGSSGGAIRMTGGCTVGIVVKAPAHGLLRNQLHCSVYAKLYPGAGRSCFGTRARVLGVAAVACSLLVTTTSEPVTQRQRRRLSHSGCRFAFAWVLVQQSLKHETVKCLDFVGKVAAWPVAGPGPAAVPAAQCGPRACGTMP